MPPSSASITIPVEPMGAPRMTQRDRWALRPAVVKYHAFKDVVRLHANQNPEFMEMLESGTVIDLSWRAFISMPASWSKKKKLLNSGAAHRQKPDRDNIDKAILDTLFKDDCGVAHGTLSKRWDDGLGARLEITITCLTQTQ